MSSHDPFIKVWDDGLGFRWRCRSCNAESDTHYLTDAMARARGEEHSCLDAMTEEPS